MAKSKPEDFGMDSTEFNRMIGNLNAYTKSVKQAQSGTDRLSGDIKGLSEGFIALYNSISDLTGQRGLGTFLKGIQGFYGGLIDVAKETTVLEQRNKQLQKTLGLTLRTAGKLSSQLDKVGTTMQIGGRYAQVYAQNLDKLFGGRVKTITTLAEKNSKFAKGLFNTQNALTTLMGLTADQAESYTRFATQYDANSDKVLYTQSAIAEIIEQQTGEVGVYRKIVEDVANLSSDIQMQYSRMPGQLEMAGLKARQLSISMESLHTTGKSLLDIESSIGSEIEYQLLSGKRLVDQEGRSLTAKYRMATLSGDMNAQADTMREIIRSQSHELETNLFARQQMAQLLGIEESAVSRMVQQEKLQNSILRDRKFLNKDGKQVSIWELSGDSLQQAVDELRKTGDATDAQIAQIKKLSDTRTTDDVLKQIYDLLDTRLVQAGASMYGGQSAVIGNTSSKIQSVFGTMTSKTGDLAETYKNKDVLSGVGAIKVGMDIFKIASKTFQEIINLNSSGASDLGYDNKVIPTNDLILSDKGAFSLNSQDQIIAAKPNGPIDKMLAGSSNTNTPDITRAIAEAFKNVNINVNMNASTLSKVISAEIDYNNSYRMA